MTQVNVYIARHFWRDGQVATWRTHERFPPEILSWLKEHYTELVTGIRAPWAVRPEGVLYLFYSDEHEVHGRLATGIAAFWSNADVIDRDIFREKLFMSSALGNNDILYLKIEANISKRNIWFKKYFILSSLAILLLVGAIFYFMPQHLSNTDEITKTHSIELPVTKIKNLTPATKIKNPADVCTWPEHKQNQIPRYCYQKFIRSKCLRETTLHYDAWLKIELSGSNPLSCPSEMDFDRDLQSEPENRKTQLKNFLRGKY